MSLRNIGIVYRKELRESLRDRRTLISTIVVPLLAFPIIFVGFGYMAVHFVGKAQKEAQKIMILGGEDSPALIAGLKKLDVAGLQKVESVEVVPEAKNYGDQITTKQIRAAVEIPSGFQAALGRGETPTVIIYKYQGEIKSEFSAERIEKFLREYRDNFSKESLTAKKLPASLLKPFVIQQKNIAPPEKVSGATIGGFIGYIVIILCMTGAMYPAMDLTAGEKERGTMETILSSPIARTHLVLGKFFLILTASLFTAVLSVISMGTSALFLAKMGGAANAAKAAEQDSLVIAIGIKAVLAVFVMALPVAVLFSATLFTIALFAKSYKEAQSYLTPMTFLIIIPAIASLLPGIELNARLAIIPILNTSLVCKEIVSGTYHWNYIALIFGSTCVYAAAAIFIAVKMFQREDVLFRA